MTAMSPAWGGAGDDAARPCGAGALAAPGPDGLASPAPPLAIGAGALAAMSPFSAADTARALAQEIATTPMRTTQAPPSATAVRVRSTGFGGNGSRGVSSEAGANTGTKIMGMVRNEMASFEAQQIEDMKRFRDSISERHEKMRESELQHLEKKLLEHAAAQSKLDRRVSELSGMFRGLHSEVQLQTQTADTVDRRVTELKHQFEEELRQKLGELEGNQMETLSKVRASTAATEDTLKRHELGIRRLETTMQEVLRKGDLWSHQAAMHHERLELLETMPRSRANVAAPSEQEMSAQVWQLEGRVGDLAKQLEQLNSDLRNDRETYHSMAAQIQEYDTRISACRSKVDGHHETLSGLDEHIRQGCEEKFEVLHKSHQELVKKHVDLHERHNSIKTSVDYLQAGAMGLPPQAGMVGVSSPHSHAVAVEIAPDVWGPVDKPVRIMDAPLPAAASRGRGPELPGPGAQPPPPRPQRPGSGHGSEVGDAGCGERSPAHSVGAASFGRQAGDPAAQAADVGPTGGVSELLEKLHVVAPKVIEHQKQLDEHRLALQELRLGAEAGAASQAAVGGLRDELRGLRCRVADVEDRLPPAGSWGPESAVSPGSRSGPPAAELYHTLPPGAAALAGPMQQHLIKQIANMDRLMGISSPAERSGNHVLREPLTGGGDSPPM